MARSVLLLAALWCCQVGGAPLSSDPNFFPIMAWNWVPNDPAVFARTREGGLTVAGFVSPGALDACQTAGAGRVAPDRIMAGATRAFLRYRGSRW
jgi:hypothetical protein